MNQKYFSFRWSTLQSMGINCMVSFSISNKFTYNKQKRKKTDNIFDLVSRFCPLENQDASTLYRLRSAMTSSWPRCVPSSTERKRNKTKEIEPPTNRPTDRQTTGNLIVKIRPRGSIFLIHLSPFCLVVFSILVLLFVASGL